MASDVRRWALLHIQKEERLSQGANDDAAAVMRSIAVRLGDPRYVAEKLGKLSKVSGVAHFKALAAMADLATAADSRAKAKVPCPRRAAHVRPVRIHLLDARVTPGHMTRRRSWTRRSRR
jgi:hypothetical protein